MCITASRKSLCMHRLLSTCLYDLDYCRDRNRKGMIERWIKQMCGLSKNIWSWFSHLYRRDASGFPALSKNKSCRSENFIIPPFPNQKCNAMNWMKITSGHSLSLSAHFPPLNENIILKQFRLVSGKHLPYDRTKSLRFVLFSCQGQDRKVTLTSSQMQHV